MIRPVTLLFAAAVFFGLAPPVEAQHEGHQGHQGHEGHGGHDEHAGMSGDDHAAHRAMLDADASDETATVTTAPSIPDLAVIDQSGDELRFFSDLVEGRVVAMNFVFTTCTTICPPMGANFGRLQEELGERLGRDVHLVSVSVDPTVDTPERLRAWGEIFGRQDGWTLVTGSKSQVDTVLKSLGAFTPDKEDHAPLVLVGNEPEGRWLRVNGLAPPTVIERAIQRVIAPEEAR